MTTIEELYNIYIQHRNITTDTRTIQGNEIFFALKGDNFDGNTFAHKALEAGAAFAVVDNTECYSQNPTKCILVDDVLAALQQLAQYHRTKTKHIPIVAITGTNGKTTTKELTTAVLSKKYRTHSTKGNYNKNMSDQEYLDRQDEYTMTFFLDEGEWLSSVIIINSWRVVINEEDI